MRQERQVVDVFLEEEAKNNSDPPQGIHNHRLRGWQAFQLLRFHGHANNFMNNPAAWCPFDPLRFRCEENLTQPPCIDIPVKEQVEGSKNP